MNWNRIVLLVACILGGTGVVMGAYQAHGLEKFLEKAEASPEDAAKRIDNCGVAVRYQMWHALALLGTGVLGLSLKRNFVAGPILTVLGVAGFSGGLYEIVFRGEATHWAIVPMGGMLMILGWTALAAGILVAKLDE